MRKNLVILALLSIFVVACDKDIEDTHKPDLRFHSHTIEWMLASSDGNASVEYIEDASRTHIFIPAAGGTFQFGISGEAKICAGIPLCGLHNEIVDDYKIKLAAHTESVWNCEKIPLTQSEEMANMEYRVWGDEKVKVDNLIINRDKDRDIVKTIFGIFESMENGFRIQVAPNLDKKEKCYVMFLEPYSDDYEIPVVYVIQRYEGEM